MRAVDDRPRQLVIRTEQDEGDFVRLTVQDTGVGIDSQNLDRLLTRFTPPRAPVWGWAYPYAAPSSSVIVAAFGLYPMTVREPRFHFLFPGFEGVTGTHNLGAIQAPAVTDAAKVMRKS